MLGRFLPLVMLHKKKHSHSPLWFSEDWLCAMLRSMPQKISYAGWEGRDSLLAHLVNSTDARQQAYCISKFLGGMDGIADGAVEDFVLSLDIHTADGNVHDVCHAADDILEELRTVHTPDVGLYGEHPLLASGEEHVADAVALLGGLADDMPAVATVDGDIAVVLTESDDLMSGQRFAELATPVTSRHFGMAEWFEKILCLIGLCPSVPFAMGLHMGIDTDFHAVAMLKNCLQRLQFAVYTGILCVLALTDFKSVVQCCTVQRQTGGGAGSVVYRNVLAVEGRNHAVHEEGIGIALGNVLEHNLELVDPAVFIVALATIKGTVFPGTFLSGTSLLLNVVEDKSKTASFNHMLRGDVDFLPTAMIAEQTDMQTLISVFLGIVDIIDHGSRTLLEVVGKYAVYFQTYGLLIACRLVGHANGTRDIAGVVNEAYDVTEVDMLEIPAMALHRLIDAVGLPPADFGTDVDASFLENAHKVVGEVGKPFTVIGLVSLKLAGKPLETVGTTVFEREVLKFTAHAVEPQTVGKGGIEIVGLTGYLHLFLRLHAGKCAHVVQTVGKFDEYGTDIVLQRFEQLAEIAFLLAAIISDVLAFRHYINKEGNIGPETPTDFLNAVGGVFHHIVEESGNDGIGPQLQFEGNDACHSHGMYDVGLATLPPLRGMGVVCKLKGIAYACHILGRGVPGNLRNHVVYLVAHHLFIVNLYHKACVKFLMVYMYRLCQVLALFPKPNCKGKRLRNELRDRLALQSGTERIPKDDKTSTCNRIHI